MSLTLKVIHLQWLGRIDAMSSGDDVLIGDQSAAASVKNFAPVVRIRVAQGNDPGPSVCQ